MTLDELAARYGGVEHIPIHSAVLLLHPVEEWRKWVAEAGRYLGMKIGIIEIQGKGDTYHPKP